MYKISIKKLQSSDIPTIVDSFIKANWTKKPAHLFEQYLDEQNKGERLIWVVYIANQFAGYITLKRHSQYAPFLAKNIPEIMDLNVLPEFRKSGIGSKLLSIAEKEAATKSEVIGLGVGLYGGSDGGYGAAQRLYVNHGYIPDGKGVTYNYKHTIPGNSYPLDDDLVLWFIKKLR